MSLLSDSIQLFKNKKINFLILITIFIYLKVIFSKIKSDKFEQKKTSKLSRTLDYIRNKYRRFRKRIRKYSGKSAYEPKLSDSINKNFFNGLNGLNNVGNTCYMNSGIQCLSNVQSFREILNNQSLKIDDLSDVFLSLLKSIWSNEKELINPHKFKNKFSINAAYFNDYHQKDSFEFVHTLLDALHTELKNEDIIKKDTFKELIGNSKLIEFQFNEKGKIIMNNCSKLSIISNLFFSITYQKVQCLKCELVSLKYDLPISSVSVPIQNSKKNSYLIDCLRLMTEKTLSVKEDYYCSICKTKTKCKSQFQFWNFSPVLIIHLNRFSLVNNRIEKNMKFINFPLKIDLKEFISTNQNTIYELVALSNHYGSIEGGHYDCFAKNSLNKKWFRFNDSCVSALNENQINTSNAYFLIYNQYGVNNRIDDI